MIIDFDRKSVLRFLNALFGILGLVLIYIMISGFGGLEDFVAPWAFLSVPAFVITQILINYSR